MLKLQILLLQLLLLIFCTTNVVNADQGLSNEPARPKLPDTLLGGKKIEFFTYFPSDPHTLYVLGDEIPFSYDFTGFQRLVRERSIKRLVLSSPGGSLDLGIDLAFTINNIGLETYIPKGEFCASACSFLFFAGKQRYALGRLGVHQFYYNDDRLVSERKALISTQKTSAKIYDALIAFNAPSFVFSKMHDQIPFRQSDADTGMYYFDEYELQQINTTVPAHFAQQENLFVQEKKYREAYRAYLIALEKYKVSQAEAEKESTQKKRTIKPTTEVESKPDVTESVSSPPSEKDSQTIEQVKPQPDSDVLSLQKLLKSNKCTKGDIDGFLGPQTNKGINLAIERLELPLSGKGKDLLALRFALEATAYDVCATSVAKDFTTQTRSILIQCKNQENKIGTIQDLSHVKSTYYHQYLQGIIDINGQKNIISLVSDEKITTASFSPPLRLHKPISQLEGSLDLSDGYWEASSDTCIFKLFKFYE